MKNQTRVLKDVYLEGKKVSFEKISKNTGLTKKQVYKALLDLDNRRLIKKSKDPNNSKRKLIEINDAVLDRIKKVIKRGENE